MWIRIDQACVSKIVSKSSGSLQFLNSFLVKYSTNLNSISNERVERVGKENKSLKSKPSNFPRINSKIKSISLLTSWVSIPLDFFLSTHSLLSHFYLWSNFLSYFSSFLEELYLMVHTFIIQIFGFQEFFISSS